MCASEIPIDSVRPSQVGGAVAVIHHAFSSQQLRLFFHNSTFPVTVATHVSCEAEHPEWCGQIVRGLVQLQIQSKVCSVFFRLGLLECSIGSLPFGKVKHADFFRYTVSVNTATSRRLTRQRWTPHERSIPFNSNIQLAVRTNQSWGRG